MVPFAINITVNDLHFYIVYYYYLLQRLKGKFSSGREGAQASKFNYDFK